MGNPRLRGPGPEIRCPGPETPTPQSCETPGCAAPAPRCDAPAVAPPPRDGGKPRPAGPRTPTESERSGPLSTQTRAYLPVAIRAILKLRVEVPRRAGLFAGLPALLDLHGGVHTHLLRTNAERGNSRLERHVLLFRLPHQVFAVGDCAAGVVGNCNAIHTLYRTGVRTGRYRVGGQRWQRPQLHPT